MSLLKFNYFPFTLRSFANITKASHLTCGNCDPKARFAQFSTTLAVKSNENSNKRPNILENFKEAYQKPIETCSRNIKSLREEFKLYIDEWRNLVKTKINVHQLGDIDIIHSFEDDSDLKKWVVSTDRSNNCGYSTAQFIRTQSETAVFSGFIDNTLPDDGKTHYTGFASVMTKPMRKSFKRLLPYDWTEYTHLVLKIRGDGRSYNIVLAAPDVYDVGSLDQFAYPLHTRGGPYWQLVKIPFSHFVFAHKGQIVDRQHMMIQSECTKIGILLADNIDGPFKLEIEYVGVEFNNFHRKVSPYEQYLLGAY